MNHDKAKIGSAGRIAKGDFFEWPIETIKYMAAFLKLSDIFHFSLTNKYFYQLLAKIFELKKAEKKLENDCLQLGIVKEFIAELNLIGREIDEFNSITSRVNYFQRMYDDSYHLRKVVLDELEEIILKDKTQTILSWTKTQSDLQEKFEPYIREKDILIYMRDLSNDSGTLIKKQSALNIIIFKTETEGVSKFYIYDPIKAISIALKTTKIIENEIFNQQAEFTIKFKDLSLEASSEIKSKGFVSRINPLLMFLLRSACHKTDRSDDDLREKRKIYTFMALRNSNFYFFSYLEFLGKNKDTSNSAVTQFISNMWIRTRTRWVTTIQKSEPSLKLEQFNGLIHAMKTVKYDGMREIPDQDGFQLNIHWPQILKILIKAFPGQENQKILWAPFSIFCHYSAFHPGIYRIGITPIELVKKYIKSNTIPAHYNLALNLSCGIEVFFKENENTANIITLLNLKPPALENKERIFPNDDFIEPFFATELGKSLPSLKHWDISELITKFTNLKYIQFTVLKKLPRLLLLSYSGFNNVISFFITKKSSNYIVSSVINFQEYEKFLNEFKKVELVEAFLNKFKKLYFRSQNAPRSLLEFAQSHPTIWKYFVINQQKDFAQILANLDRSFQFYQESFLKDFKLFQFSQLMDFSEKIFHNDISWLEMLMFLISKGIALPFDQLQCRTLSDFEQNKEFWLSIYVKVKNDNLTASVQFQHCIPALVIWYNRYSELKILQEIANFGLIITLINLINEDNGFNLSWLNTKHWNNAFSDPNIRTILEYLGIDKCLKFYRSCDSEEPREMFLNTILLLPPQFISWLVSFYQNKDEIDFLGLCHEINQFYPQNIVRPINYNANYLIGIAHISSSLQEAKENIQALIDYEISKGMNLFSCLQQISNLDFLMCLITYAIDDKRTGIKGKIKSDKLQNYHELLKIIFTNPSGMSIVETFNFNDLCNFKNLIIYEDNFAANFLEILCAVGIDYIKMPIFREDSSLNLSFKKEMVAKYKRCLKLQDWQKKSKVLNISEPNFKEEKTISFNKKREGSPFFDEQQPPKYLKSDLEDETKIEKLADNSNTRN